MRFARKLELPCNARSYCPLWRTFAAAPGSGEVCPKAGAANDKSNEAIAIVHDRLVTFLSLAVYHGKARVLTLSGEFPSRGARIVLFGVLRKNAGEETQESLSVMHGIPGCPVGHRTAEH